jgi:hypothetical protein
MKLTKMELDKFRSIYKKYTGEDLPEDISEAVFLDFIRLISSIIKNN